MCIRDSREVVAGYLARAGLTVDEAADGMDALDRARHTPPDVVVLDLMLPGLDGLEAVSYTHLDVYKRQGQQHMAIGAPASSSAARSSAPSW